MPDRHRRPVAESAPVARKASPDSTRVPGRAPPVPTEPAVPPRRCGRYLSGLTFSSGTWSPTFISYPPDDVGPDRVQHLLAVLVDGRRLEDVEALAVFLVDLGALRGRRDLVARAGHLAPLEDLAA